MISISLKRRLKTRKQSMVLIHWLCERVRGLSLFFNAVSNNFNDIDVFEVLLDRGFDVNESALFNTLEAKMDTLFSTNSYSYDMKLAAELLLYCGLNPTRIAFVRPHMNSPLSQCCLIVNRSRALCIFKIFYHKFIYLNIDSLYQLLRTLLFEGLY